MRILVAGVGNVLRADDAFGCVVAQQLSVMDLGEDVTVIETGIGGIALVQELQSGYDALVVIDAVDRGRPAGHVMLIEPEVIDVKALSDDARNDLLADMHLATPGRAMMLAKALGVLPGEVLMVGCQPEDPDSVGTAMSVPVTAAIPVAVDEIVHHIDRLRLSAPAVADAAVATAAVTAAETAPEGTGP